VIFNDKFPVRSLEGLLYSMMPCRGIEPNFLKMGPGLILSAGTEESQKSNSQRMSAISH
jgi:hypothetical protein